MQQFRIIGAALAASIAMGGAQFARADDIYAESYGYLGLGAGRSYSRLDDARIADELDAPGFTTSSIDTDSHKNAYKVFGGGQFNRGFALEGSYFDLGKFKFFAPSSPAGAMDGSIDVRGFALDAVGLLPFAPNFSAFAKLGVTEAQTRDSFTGVGPNFVNGDNSPKEWHTNPKVGAGLLWLLSPHFGLRGEWERYRIADAVRDHGNVDAWTVSLVFPFGAAAVTAAPIAAAPPPPPPPAPAPVVVPPPAPPPPPPPAPRHVTFDADALFAFNSAVLRPEGTHDLDTFAAELRNTSFDQVHVNGYADRLGSEAYNLRLSQQRADAVRNYLVRNSGVDPTRIIAEGRGKTNPVTKPGQCNMPRSAALIACLQPDRRVEVEVSGTAN